MNELLVCVIFLSLTRPGSAQTIPEQIAGDFPVLNAAIVAKLSNDVPPTINTETLSFSGLLPGIPHAVIHTELGFDRQFCKLHNFSTSGSFIELDFDQTSAHVFIQIAFLPNSDRLYGKIFHTVETTFSVAPGAATKNSFSGVFGSCNSTSTVFAYTSAGSTTIIGIQFFVSLPPPPSQVTNSTSAGGGTSRTETLTVAPMRTVVGYLALGKSSGTLSEAELGEINSIIIPVVCNRLTSYSCCDHGSPVVGSNGETTCSCQAGYYGACCDKLCVNGTVATIPPLNSLICSCNSGWGGPSCDIKTAGTHFLSKVRFEGEECQDHLSNHYEYRYDADDQTQILNPAPISIRTNKIQIGVNGEFANITYREVETLSLSSVALTAWSVTRNDFLLATSIDTPNVVDGDITVKVSGDLVPAQGVDNNATYRGNLQKGTCKAMYDIIQRFGTDSSNSMAEIFFVIGKTGLSQFPTQTQLIPSTFIDNVGGGTFVLTDDAWMVSGNMSEIVVGYNFLMGTGKGAMVESEILNVLDCYVQKACDALPEPPECARGTLQLVGGNRVCVCNEGFIGPACKFPIC